MDFIADKLGRIGAVCGQNKYLRAITNAFQNFMPATIAGAVGVLWTNVIVNDSIVNGTPQGLGGVLPFVMGLKPLNSVFSALQFCTISCISIGIVMLVAQEIGEANGEVGAFPAILGFMSWAIITPTTHTLSEYVNKSGEAAIFNGFDSSYIGATGLFTALLVGIVALELYNQFRKMDALKIKMPDQVPPGVARAFEVLVPTFLTLTLIGVVGGLVQMLTGDYLNNVIFNAVQKPLTSIIGGNLIAVLVMYVVISLFWLVGIHGDNMVNAIKESIFRPMLVANTVAFTSNEAIPNIFNLTMLNMFATFGGGGTTIGLVIAIFIFGKREDNRAIATLSIVPGLFNINETVIFGVPLVLNPILAIPFVVAPCVCLIIGYLLITVGFCPRVVIEVPWTTPPILAGFLATGGSIFGALSQLIALLASILIYTPFLMAYEKYQNRQEVNV